MTLVKGDPHFEHSLKLGLCSTVKVADNTYKKGKSLKVRYFGLAQREDVEKTIIPEIKSKPELLNNLPIIAYSYYSGYPPRKTIGDIISTTRGPIDHPSAKKRDEWLIDEQLNIIKLPDPKITIIS